MKFILRHTLVAALLCAGIIQPLRAGSLFVGGNTGDANDHLFTYNSGGTLTNTSERPLNVMGNPGQIAIGSDGNVYIVDQDPSNGPGVDIFNGTNGQYIGQYLASSFSSGLNTPTGLAFGSDGKLYINDSANDTLWSYDGTSLIQVIASNAGLSAPVGMVFGPGGFLYIANANSGVVSRWDGTNLIAGFTSVVDSGGAFSDVTLQIDGKLYVTDTTNGVIQVFQASDGSYLGHFGNTGSVLVQPIGLAFAPNGDLFVTDALGIDVFNSAGIFQNQLVQFTSNPGDQNMGLYLAFATSASATPEPSALLLSGVGLLGLCAFAHRRQRAAKRLS